MGWVRAARDSRGGESLRGGIVALGGSRRGERGVVGWVECSSSSSSSGSGGSNDAIRRVMQNDVTLGAGVTVLSQGQPVQGPAAQPPLNPWRATAPRSSSPPRCSSRARHAVPQPFSPTIRRRDLGITFANLPIRTLPSLVSPLPFYSSNIPPRPRAGLRARLFIAVRVCEI